jgi:ATP-binding cassette subfamily B protein
VAHRLSTIAHLDRILVFDQGRIIEDGKHGELIGRRGAYWRLWSKQAGGFLDEGAERTPEQLPMAPPPREPIEQLDEDLRGAATGTVVE